MINNQTLRLRQTMSLFMNIRKQPLFNIMGITRSRKKPKSSFWASYNLYYVNFRKT